VSIRCVDSGPYRISITLAVLIVSFVAGDKLRRPVRLLIVFLYLGASWIFVVRCYRATLYWDYALSLYEAANLASHFRGPTVRNVRNVLFALGTLASAAFVLFPRIGLRKPAPGDT
jgi:hypothetical protein